MNNKLISVIVPIYKVEQYLNECINSIINQTYKNLEVILVDDGSPDNCGKICDEYAKKDKRIKVIHKENGGLSSARNAGLDIATGEYISFIDSDDYVSENFIEVLYNLCEKNNADISVCDYIKFVDRVENIECDIEIKKYNSIEMQEKMYSDECVKAVVVWNKLYKKYIYDNLRFPEGKINEDEFTTYKAFDKTTKNIAVTNEPLYYYRYNENSIMGRKFNKKRLDVLDALEERKNYYKKKKLYSLYEKTVIAYQNKLKEFYILTKKNIEKNKKILKNIEQRSKENFPEYKLLKDIEKKRLIKMYFFVKAPLLYYFMIKILKWLKNFFENVITFFKHRTFDFYRLKCKIQNKKKYILFETPIHGNLGDQAILIAEEKMLKDNKISFFEVSTYEQKYYIDYIKERANNNDVVFITGGGFIGTLWKNENTAFNNVLEKFKENRILIFPQTFYYESNKNGENELLKTKRLFDSLDNLIICVREKFSYELAKKEFSNKIIFCPDIVLYLRNNYKRRYKRSGVSLCLRKDKEGVIKNKEKIYEIIESVVGNEKIFITDTVINKKITKNRRKGKVIKKLNEFSKSKLVITDRLHGMIFAVLTKTPCIVLNNNNYKIKGVYEWIKSLDYIIFEEDINNLKKAIKALWNKEISYNDINLDNAFWELNTSIRKLMEDYNE